MAFTPRTWVVGEVVTAALMNQEVRDGSLATFQELLPWTPLSTIGSFGTNFSAGAPTPRMRKVRLGGVEEWWFEGRINTSSFAAATTLTMFTLNTGYRVASERGFTVYASTSAHYPVRLGFLSSGAVTGSVPSAAGTTTSVVWLDGVRITNPLA
ncbi:hypothetical protein ACGFRG_08055 [Streptomyces sp. NPDC048696]|uniref:hypothetical protein n=1 Tax=Streptomyces sp. NPDC048696 TaxID=3365585 RepID=UPI00371CF688